MGQFNESIEDVVICQDYNNILNDNDIDLMNAGYYPIYDQVKNNNDDLKYGESLYINALEGITTTNKTIIDLGCGRGGGPRVYQDYFDFNQVYGCDININSIEYAQKKNKNIKYSTSTFMTLDYDIKFDIITQVESYWLIKDYDYYYTLINKILKEDGVYISLDYFIKPHTFINKFKYYKVINLTDNIINSCKNNIAFLEKNTNIINNFLLNKYKSHMEELKLFSEVGEGKYLKYIFSNKELK